jgi:hypothetical protein
MSIINRVGRTIAGPARRAKKEAMLGARRAGAQRLNTAGRVTSAAKAVGRRDFGAAPPQVYQAGVRKSIASSARQAGDQAYKSRMALTKKRYAKYGSAAVAVQMVQGKTSETSANQSTFAARRMRKQNVGISSGALQGFEMYSRSIGGY